MKITQLDTETNKHLETIKSLTDRSTKAEQNRKDKNNRIKNLEEGRNNEERGKVNKK